MLKHWKLVSLNLIAVAIGAYFAIFGFNLPGNKIDHEDIAGILWPQQKQLNPFSMTAHTGEVFNLNSLQGQWNLLFFGYTYCPDICPVTMNALREVTEIMAEKDNQNQQSVKMVFISVDGERDVTAHLANYINFYGDTFSAASGDKQAVDSLTKQLGVPYEIEAHEPGDNYLVSHTGSLFLLSPDGRLFAILQSPHDPAGIAVHLKTILQFVAQNS